MLKNKKLFGITLICLAISLSACGKRNNNNENIDATNATEATTLQQQTQATDNSEDELEDETVELEKPEESKRISIDLALVKNDIYDACFAPTFNRKNKDTTMEKYNIHFFDTRQQAIEALKSKTVNMAVIDTDTAAKLYNEGADIKIIATNTLNNLYVTSLVDSVNEFSNDLSMLNEKTVYVAKDNSSAQTMIELGLKNTGCKIEYVNSNDEIVSMIEQGKGEYFAAPEPYHTTARLKNAKLNLVADLSLVTELTYPTSVIVANSDFVEANKDAMLYILDDHLKSIKTTVHAPTRTVQWAKDNDMTTDPTFYLSSMQNLNFAYYDGEAMAGILQQYYTEISKLNSNVISSVPDTDLYYIN